MGRLTKRIETEFPRGIQKGIELDEMLNVYEDDMFYECAEKLAHYEDMEEQGYKMVNIDKIVKQLEEKYNHYSNMDSMVALGRRLAYKEAIEIVKKGGVADEA